MAIMQNTSGPTPQPSDAPKTAPPLLKIPPPAPPSIIHVSPNPFPSTKGVFSDPHTNQRGADFVTSYAFGDDNKVEGNVCHVVRGEG
jgi:hypothetical protein